MTKPTDDAKEQEHVLQALNETWSRMDDTFAAQPAPLPDWMALVRERKRIAKRKLWKELALLWSVAVPMLGVMLLLLTGMQTVFWIFQAAATAAGIPWLIAEFKRAARAGSGGVAP
jgi:hypothetical protein